MDYSQILGIKAPLPAFADPDTGKSYQVSYLVQSKKAEFEAWLRANAQRLLFEMRPHLSDYDWRLAFQMFRDDVSAGKFCFHGDLATQARGTVDGSAQLASILFGCPFDEMLDLAGRHPDLVKATLDLAVAMSSRREPAAPPAPAATPTDWAETPEGNAPKAAP